MTAFVFALVTLASAATPLPSPAPQATPPLKVIVNVRSSSLCSAVRSMAVPIGYVTRRNDEAFSAIDHSMLSFMENTRGATPAGAAELRSMGNDLDDLEVYTPTNEANVVQMDKIAYEILQNVTLEDHAMNQSWHDYPKGHSESVDAFRQRMQNLIDLQRALANKYMDFTGIYLDNRGQARFSQSAAEFKSVLRDTIMGLGSALADSRTQSDPEMLPKADARAIVRRGNVAEIVRELRLQEQAFSQEITTAGHACGI